MLDSSLVPQLKFLYYLTLKRKEGAASVKWLLRYWRMETNKPVIIAVDTGNKLIKTVNTSFVAGIEQIPESLKALSNPMDTIHYNGDAYSIGLSRTLWERDKTKNSTYLILTLLAVAKEIAFRKLPTELDVVLVIGLPPGHLREETIVEKYRKYYLSNGGEYRFLCGDKRHRVKVKDVIVCPQNYSAVMTLSESIVMLPSLYLIDIGGGTSDTVHFEYSKSDNREVSLDLGVIVMYSEVTKKLDAKFGRKISETKVDDILLRGDYTHYDAEHIQLVHDVAEQHIRTILGKHKDLGMDLASAHVVFLGGGSMLLKKQIQAVASEFCGGLAVLNDIHANAKGYELFARIKLASV